MTIVAAVDYDTNGTYPQVVADYLAGVTDGLAGEYKTGVYGSIYVVDAALALKHAVHGVQTVAWSHGKVSSWAHLYQHGGSEFQGTDYNDILHTPHGTWLQTLPPPPPPSEDSEMKAFLIHVPSTPPSWWVVTADLTARKEVSEDSYVALKGTGQYLTNPGIDQATFAGIPVVAAS